MKKKLFLWGSVFLFLMVSVLPVSARVKGEIPSWDAIPEVSTEEMVHDFAHLLTSGEIKKLEAQALSLKERFGYDVVLLTTDNTQQRSGITYARDFFEANGFGQGKKQSGIVFSIDMEHRTMDFATFGRCIRIFTDNNIEYVLDQVEGLIASGNYGQAFEEFLHISEQVFQAWPRHVAKVIGVQLGVSILLGILFALVVYQIHRSALREKPSLQVYQSPQDTHLQVGPLRLINTYVTSVAKPQNNNHSGGGSGGGISFSGGSSTSSTSSGGSSGGGSRSF